MATKDGFSPNDRFPLLLSEHAGEGEQPGMWNAWDGTVISSPTLKTSFLFAAAAPFVIAVLWMGNPTVRIANATTSLASTFAAQDGYGHGYGRSMPTIRTTAGGQTLPPTARQAPSREEITAALKAAFQIQTGGRRQSTEVLLTQFQSWAAEEKANDQVAAALEPADQGQAGIREPSAEVLLKEFQNWAAGQDVRAQPEPVQPAQYARAQVRPVQKHRQVHPVQNVRAEIRPVPNARAQDRPAQDAQAPWLLRSIGWVH